MKIFLLQQFNQLELFIKDCPTYEGTFPEQVAVALSYTALFLYAIFLVEVRYISKTVFHLLLWLGLLCNMWSGTIADQFLPKSAIIPAECSQEGVTVCEQASMVIYVTVFMLFYHVNHVNDGWVYTGTVFVMLVVLCMTSIMSLLVLNLFTLEEVAAGGVIGGVWAVLMSLISLCFIEPRFKNGSLGRFTSTLDLNPTQFA
jgi:hypothetical protein